MVIETVGQRIRRLREAAGLSQNALAVRLGVTPQSVFQWERGERFPRPANQGPLAEVLGTTATYLMTGRHLAGAEMTVPSDIAGVYARLHPVERETWVRIGHVLREQQGQHYAALQAEEERRVAEEPETYEGEEIEVLDEEPPWRIRDCLSHEALHLELGASNIRVWMAQRQRYGALLEPISA